MSSQFQAAENDELQGGDDDDEIRPKFQIDQNAYSVTREITWVQDNALCEPTEELRSIAAAAALEEKHVKKVKQIDRKRKKRDGDVALADSNRRGSREFKSWEQYCELPFTLKTLLLDEKDRIMRVSFRGPKAGVETDFEPGQWRTARDVHNLPASVPIKSILSYYVKMKRKEAATPEAATAAEKSAKGFVNGIAKLFEEALPVCLLYHPERAQYIAIQANLGMKSLHKTEIYGCEYLLRLIVRLPVILEDLGNAVGRHETGQHIESLIILLQRNRPTCFKPKYREPFHDELNKYEMALMSGTCCDK